MLTDEELRRADREMRSRQFARAVQAFAMGQGGLDGTLMAAKAMRASKDIVEFLKASVAGHALISGGGEALAEPTLVEGFLAALASVGVFDFALANGMAPGAAHTQFGVVIVNPTAGTRVEGASTRATLAVLQRGTLDEREAAALVVLPRELVRHARGLNVLESALKIGAVAQVDGVFLAAVGNAAAVIAASGPDAADTYNDIRLALAAIPSDANARFMVALGPALAKRMAAVTNTVGALAFPDMTPNGGVLCGLPAIATDAAGDDVVILDAAAFVGEAQPPEIALSENATLQLSDMPTAKSSDGASPPQPVEASVVSMFQTNSVAMRVRRKYAFAPLRSSNAAKITGAAALWGKQLVGSPPTLV